jgi:TonB family protein
MKNIVLLIVLCASYFTNIPLSWAQEKEEPIYKVVNRMPKFKGGQQAMADFLSRKFRYPKTARKNNVQGKVIVGFVVDVDGSVKDAKILKSLDADCDAEALRVVNLMSGKWIPCLDFDKKPVKVAFSMPINFTLN